MKNRFSDLVQDIFTVFVERYEQEILDIDEFKRCIELCEEINSYFEGEE